METIAPIIVNGIITLGVIGIGGQYVVKRAFNGIYDRLDKHDGKLDIMSERLTRVETILEVKVELNLLSRA